MDKIIKCKCGAEFEFTKGEQKFYAEKGLSEPKRCPKCRAEKKQKNEARVSPFGDGKIQGKCESCGQDTILVEEVGLCGPCCFGEADTINGNW